MTCYRFERLTRCPRCLNDYRAELDACPVCPWPTLYVPRSHAEAEHARTHPLGIEPSESSTDGLRRFVVACAWWLVAIVLLFLACFIVNGF
jgi:hypothetical protein